LVTLDYDSRPVIGLTTDTRDVDFGAAVIRSVTVGQDYVRAVWEAGGLPLLLPTLHTAAAGSMIQACHGLLLIGGGDIDPALYGEIADPKTGEIDRDRDDFELATVRTAMEMELPVLGVCRGAQLINVALGGSLRQDLASDASNHWSGFEPVHPVLLEPDSILSTIYERTELKVNSMHHQAVARPGEGLRPTAWSPDLVIEAIEHDTKWIVGVQWHPECPSAAGPDCDTLLREFVGQAASVAASAVSRSRCSPAA